MKIPPSKRSDRHNRPAGGTGDPIPTLAVGKECAKRVQTDVGTAGGVRFATAHEKARSVFYIRTLLYSVRSGLYRGIGQMYPGSETKPFGERMKKPALQLSQPSLNAKWIVCAAGYYDYRRDSVNPKLN
jgi:hypothetical protein